MSRSVSYASGAKAVCYRDVSDIDVDFGWDDFKDDLRSIGKANWASFYDSDVWVGREDKAILENKFAYIGVSEYCGLASVWLVAKDDDYVNPNIRDAWIDRISAKFDKVFGELVKVGTFSNGESVYQKKGG